MANNALKSDFTIACRPFIKWAGGKGQLLPELIARIPNNFNNYFEPFIGGGALFFALQPTQAFLSDINPELINVYQVVRSKVGELIKDLSQHVYQKDYFYRIRDIDRNGRFKLWGDVKKASRLIYLNKTCFNGLYRVNSRGEFNVPFGRYTNPKICDSDNLKSCSKALQTAIITINSFDYLTAKAKKGDFVYFDPPYAPLNATSNFTGYAKDGFCSEMQILLRDVCLTLDRKGVKFMLSNSAAPLIIDLYSQFNLEKVKASRAINSKGTKRGKIDEVIVRNYN